MRASWIIFAGLALAAGCGAEDSALAVPSLTACASDADCAPDKSCHRSQCLSRTHVAVRAMDVEITPPTGSGLARTQILQLTVDTGLEALFDLETPTTFGAVQVLDGQGAPIAARLLFRGEPRIPGRETDSQILLDRDRTTSLVLLPGRYDVRVLPTDTGALPGVEIRDFEVRPGMVPRRDLSVPSRYRVVRGEVARRTVSSYKIPGVTVRARSIGAGLSSTRAISDGDGRYEILLPDTPDATFLLTAEPPADTGPAWSFAQTITLLGDTSRELPIPLEETTDAVRGALRLRVLGRGPAGPAPVAGARVVLTASTGLDYRALTVEGVTDAEGYITDADGQRDVRALGAHYQVRVEPPLTSAWQVGEATLDLTLLASNIALDKQLELAPRTAVRGTVASSLGQAVADARVTFEPADGGPRVIAVNTDASGTYTAALEAGRYVVTVTPTPNSKVAEPLPVGFSIVDVAAGGGTLEAAPITLSAGSVLRGRVRAPGGASVPRAEVELFMRFDGRARSLGRTLTDDQGSFALIVPAS